MNGAQTQQQDEGTDDAPPRRRASTDSQLSDGIEMVAITIRTDTGGAIGGEEASLNRIIRSRDTRRLSWFGFKARLRFATGSTRVKISPDTTGSLEDIELGALSPSTSTAIASPVSAGEVALKSSASLEAAKQGKGTTPSAKSLTSCLGRLLLLYSDALDKRPVLTKAISSGLIGLLGDLTAQSIEWGFSGSPAPWSGLQAIWRSCAVMLDGFFLNGPLLHYAYELLEKYMPAEESVLSAVMQVGVDVFVIDPVFAFLFVWSTGLVEGRSIENEILKTIEYSYPEMVGWLIILGLCWAPLQVYLFNRYPVQFRVLVADIIDLVWTCVTSFFCHV